MQLIIDIGNTLIKAGVFEGKELKESYAFSSAIEFNEAEIFKKYSIRHCILASVIDGIEPFISELKLKTNVLIFTSSTETPLKNLYHSAHTLGSDRLAAAVGGNALFPDKDLLVIDSGTCIKYNFVNRKNEFIGGSISPGLRMRFKALHTFTSRLPLLDIVPDFETLTGTNSEESILSGVLNGAAVETEGIIEKYKAQYPDITVVLTGGDVNFFEKRLKKPIFADSFLILRGLNRILDHNLKSGISK